MCDITIRNGCAVQVHITNLVVIAGVHASAEIPAVQGVETEIEGAAAIDAPVTVDILRTGYTSTGFLVIGNNITNRITRGAEPCIGTETPMTLCLGNLEAFWALLELRSPHHLEVHVQVCIERGLESWVTHRDVQGVRVIIDIEQLRDTRLRRLSSQLHLKVGLLVETVTHIQGW